MPGPPRSPFQYAVLRVVPRVDRGECLNAGVVLFARTLDFLAAQVALDERRLAALAPEADAAAIARRLDALRRIAGGEAQAGPIARLERHQRFHWLVSPSSTVVQPSEVHTGLCDDPGATLDHLFQTLVV